jgi:hypothetical protein
LVLQLALLLSALVALWLSLKYGKRNEKIQFLVLGRALVTVERQDEQPLDASGNDVLHTPQESGEIPVDGASDTPRTDNRMS